MQREILELEFPEFPYCEWYYITDKEETVISSDWFIDVAKFKNEYDGLKNEYDILRNKSEELNER